MVNSFWMAIVGLAAMLLTQPASACRTTASLEIEDIKFASIVVIGRVVNYEIVRDEEFRRQYKKVLERASNKLSPDWIKEYARVTSKEEHFFGDYARFTVLVGEVLVGQPSKAIIVTWSDPAFGKLEKMKEGSYLFALREPSSESPPLRGPSATILSPPESNAMTVLQAPCAPAFIFETSKPEVKIIRNILMQNLGK